MITNRTTIILAAVLNVVLGINWPAFELSVTSIDGGSLRALSQTCSLHRVLASGDPGWTEAQSCNPAVVSCIVRDGKGNVLSEADLKSIQEQLPKSIDDADVFVSQVSIAEDGKTYYWPESVEFERGKKVPSLDFANARTCTMHLTEVTLAYQGKKMRLIFNIEIERRQDDRRPIVTLPAFENGTFQLDLTGWTRQRDQIIPAERWKKAKPPS